jgi:hypothetical protein
VVARPRLCDTDLISQRYRAVQHDPDDQQGGHRAFSDLLMLGDAQVLAAGKVAGNGSNAAVYRAQTTP